MHSGEVCKAEGGSLNLHEPGTARALVEGLTDDEREQISEATRTLGNTRTVSLGVWAPEPNLRLKHDA